MAIIFFFQRPRSCLLACLLIPALTEQNDQDFSFVFFFFFFSKKQADQAITAALSLWQSRKPEWMKMLILWFRWWYVFCLSVKCTCFTLEVPRWYLPASTYIHVYICIYLHVSHESFWIWIWI